MGIDEILVELNQFKGGRTDQEWIMDPPFPFENDYIKVLRIATSNQAGGSDVENGKQWGIIIERYKDFTVLSNWIKLKEKLGDDIDVTPVAKGEYKGKHGIRLYKMSRNPNERIIEKLLEFIFNEHLT